MKKKQRLPKMAEVEEFEEVHAEPVNYLPQVPSISSLTEWVASLTERLSSWLPALTEWLSWLEIGVAVIVILAALIGVWGIWGWISTSREMRRQKLS